MCVCFYLLSKHNLGATKLKRVGKSNLRDLQEYISLNI